MTGPLDHAALALALAGTLTDKAATRARNHAAAWQELHAADTRLNAGHHTDARRHLQRARRHAEIAARPPTDWLDPDARAAYTAASHALQIRAAAGIQRPPVNDTGRALTLALEHAQHLAGTLDIPSEQQSCADVIAGLRCAVQAHAAFEAGDDTAARQHVRDAGHHLDAGGFSRRVAGDVQPLRNVLHLAVYALGGSTAFPPAHRPEPLHIPPLPPGAP